MRWHNVFLLYLLFLCPFLLFVYFQAQKKREERVTRLGATQDSLDRGYADPRRLCLRFIHWECILAVGVLACTAVLTQTMPPHVTGFPSSGEMPVSDMPGMKMD